MKPNPFVAATKPRMLPPSFEGVTPAEIRASAEYHRRFASEKQREAESKVDAIWAEQEAERVARFKQRRRTG